MIRIRGSKHAFDCCCSEVATGEAILDILGEVGELNELQGYHKLLTVTINLDLLMKEF